MLSVGLNVMWLARCKYFSDNCVELHVHNFYHYVFVVDGTGKIQIDGKEYVLQKKHLYLTPKNVKHCFKAGGKSGLQMIEIKFGLSDSAMIEKTDQLPHQMAGGKLGIEKSLEQMIEEAIKKDRFHTDIINIKFSEILLYLMKESTIENDTLRNIKISSGIQEKDSYFEPVIAYMSRNMGLSIGLNDLSGIMHLNKSYFCKIFTLKYGISPIRFLNEMRVSKAKDLLHYSNMNITQISYEIGFQSVHYFSRFFTRKEGISPYEYKQKSKGNIFIYLDQDFSKASS